MMTHHSARIVILTLRNDIESGFGNIMKYLHVLLLLIGVGFIGITNAHADENDTWYVGEGLKKETISHTIYATGIMMIAKNFRWISGLTGKCLWDQNPDGPHK